MTEMSKQRTWGYDGINIATPLATEILGGVRERISEIYFACTSGAVLLTNACLAQLHPALGGSAWLSCARLKPFESTSLSEEGLLGILRSKSGVCNHHCSICILSGNLKQREGSGEVQEGWRRVSEPLQGSGEVQEGRRRGEERCSRGQEGRRRGAGEVRRGAGGEARERCRRGRERCRRGAGEVQEGCRRGAGEVPCKPNT